MIMIVLNMMNNHVKYQRTLYLSLFVLSSFGYLRPVTCQTSFSPSSSHPKSCHNAARTLCEYIRIPIRVLSALTRLMFQMVDAVVVSLLPLLALLCCCCCCSMWASISTASVLRSPFRLLFLCNVKCFHNRRTATTTTTMPHDSRILEIHVVLVLPLF